MRRRGIVFAEIGKSFGSDDATNGARKSVECELEFPADGKYLLAVKYASNASRPVDMYLNKQLIVKYGLRKVIGNPGKAQGEWEKLGIIHAAKGRQILRIVASEDSLPCIEIIKCVATER